MSKPSCRSIRAAYERLGYRIFDGRDPSGGERDLDLNIFGLRTTGSTSNDFDDWLGVFWRDPQAKKWQYRVWPATTDPGRYYLRNPLNVSGTAILAEGQHRGSHRIGQHRQYTALVQNKPLPVYRDRNRDDLAELMPDALQVGLFGINIHRASAFQRSRQVDRWSAGCQVFADPTHFSELMDICSEAAELWGPVFTYTLLNQAQLVPPKVGSPPATEPEGEEQSAAELLDAALAGRPRRHRTYGSLRASAAVSVAEAVVGELSKTRLQKPTPKALRDRSQTLLTADRLNRDIGPFAADAARVLRWQPVAPQQLKACRKVGDFLDLCFGQLTY